MAKVLRNIINISLPQEMAQEVRREVKAGGFATTSEFFRDLLRGYKKARLAEELRREREAFGRGRSKKLTSLRDLR